MLKSVQAPLEGFLKLKRKALTTLDVSEMDGEGDDDPETDKKEEER